MAGELIPQIRIEDVTAATDVLLRQSKKFEAFFSRAELELHIAMALGSTRAAVMVEK